MEEYLPKPADLFDREREWENLLKFTTDQSPGVTIGLVYGRRRQGKSFLLRRIAQATGGFYHQALEVETTQALDELGEKLGAHVGVGPLALRTWDEALRQLGTLSRSTSSVMGAAILGASLLGGATQKQPGVAILDEFPYHLAKTASLPSLIQRAVDESQDGGSNPLRLILCGSAMSIMEDLLNGPLRGRIKAQVVVRPFTYREFAEYWGIQDPGLAFHVHAVVGGTPGYKSLVRSTPNEPADFDKWVLEEILSPSSALFNEDEFLLGEERALTNRSLYHSVLATVAGGATSEAQIASAVGRSQRGIQHSLGVLVRTGFISKNEDVLRDRRPIYRIADPIIRFHQVVTKPDLSRFEDRQGPAAWNDAQPRFKSQVLGPHFEQLVREFVSHYASESITGGPIGKVGSAVLSDPHEKAQHELDVVALAPGSNSKKNAVRLLGEAKLRMLGMGDLGRLEGIRALLDSPSTHLLFASAIGFDPRLTDEAKTRSDVALLTLKDIFGN